MRLQEKVRVIIVIAPACAFLALTLVPATAQNPSQSTLARPLNQQRSDQQKTSSKRQNSQGAPQPQDAGDASIKIPTEMVQLDVKVTDQSGRPVSGLTKDDFVVYEDKISQSIESVSREEAPVSMGLAIDGSGSMLPKLHTVSNAARGLIRQMRPDDEAFLAQFNTVAELVQEFTADRRELEEALKKLYATGGTALLDAIIAAADHTHKKGKRRRKALIVITDGLDKNSSMKEKEVIEAMKEDEVQLYLVGFVAQEASDWLFGRSAGRKAKNLLVRLAEESGGRAFFPSDLSEMDAISAQIAKDLRAQYVISYYPNNDRRAGIFHSVRVMVNNRKLIARTRQGYYSHN